MRGRVRDGRRQVDEDATGRRSGRPRSGRTRRGDRVARARRRAPAPRIVVVPETRSCICARVRFGTRVGRVGDEADALQRERREDQPARVVRAERALGQAGVDDPARGVRDPGRRPAADEREPRRVARTRAGRRTRGRRDHRLGRARAAHRDRARRAGRQADGVRRRDATVVPPEQAARTFVQPTAYRAPRCRRRVPHAALAGAQRRGPPRAGRGQRRPSAASASTARRRPVRPRSRTLSTLRPPRSWRDRGGRRASRTTRATPWLAPSSGDLRLRVARRPRPWRVANRTRTCGGLAERVARRRRWPRARRRARRRSPR